MPQPTDSTSHTLSLQCLHHDLQGQQVALGQILTLYAAAHEAQQVVFCHTLVHTTTYMDH